MKPKNPIFHAATLALLGLSPTLCAATLTLDAVQRVNFADPAPNTISANLTTQGTLDWAYWASNVATLQNSPLVPTNEKNNGSTIISSLATVGTGSFRGSTTADAQGRYTWTDGTGPASGAGVNLDGGLVFNSTLGTNAANKGFSLTLKGDPGVNRYALLYFGGFGANGTLTLTLNGATTIINSDQVYGSNSPKSITAYQVIFRPDNASDELLVQYTATSVTDVTNAHVGIEAVTVGLLPVIPEPTAALLSGLGALFLIGKRRR